MSDAPATPETATDPTAVEEAPYELSMQVDIQSTGPCKKHVKVVIPRKDVDHFYQQSIDKFQGEAAIPGFRVGHVPAKLVEKRFRKELADQVKQDLLMQSLETISEKHDLQAIDQPDLDVSSIEIPEEGDFLYEFDVEVRPEFDLPNYSGLKLERPVRNVTEADVERAKENYLAQYASLEERDGACQPKDIVQLTLRATHGGEMLREIVDFFARLKPILRFVDAELPGFDTLLTGKSVGDEVATQVTISSEANKIEMRGEAVDVTLKITAIKRVVLPELNAEFLSRAGFETAGELEDAIRNSLERQVTYEQRQSTRKQVLRKITSAADWELPESLVLKQVENAMRREMLEMQQAGYTPAQIRARENEMQQKAVSETRQALKEHFVLDKIATEENISVSPSDIEAEIQYMAMSRGESPRRVRARLVKSGMIENLEAQIRERKAVDVIIERAEFKDVPTPLDDSRDNVEAVRYALCQQVSYAPEESAEEADAGDDA